MAKQKFDPDKAFKSIVSPKIDNTENHEKKVEPVKNSASTLIVDIQAQEKKTKRINLLLKPSIYSKSMDKCKNENVSLNEVVNKLLEAWTN